MHVDEIGRYDNRLPLPASITLQKFLPLSPNHSTYLDPVLTLSNSVLPSLPNRFRKHQSIFLEGGLLVFFLPASNAVLT